MSAPPHLIVAWIGLIAASVTDITTGRIPNVLTATMMVLGIGTHVVLGDPWFGVIGLGAAFAVHFTLWVLQVIKAGDAKLMMGLGACVGWFTMIEATVWWLVLFFPIGIAMLVAKNRLHNLGATLRHVVDRAMGRPSEDPEQTVAIVGPVLAVAGFLATLTDWMEGVLR